MSKRFRAICTAFCAGVLAAIVLFQYNVHREPYANLLSASGEYRIECVDVLFPHVAGKYVYFRFVDLSDPSTIYRSPVVDERSLDLHGFENEHEVGVRWLMFKKMSHQFELSYPQWRESWLNLLISNAKYTVQLNG